MQSRTIENHIPGNACIPWWIQKIALIVILLKVLKCKMRLRSISQIFEFFKKAVIIVLQEVFKVIFSLLWWGAWTEEVGELNPRPANAGVLKIYHDEISWIFAIQIWIPFVKLYSVLLSCKWLIYWSRLLYE